MVQKLSDATTMDLSRTVRRLGTKTAFIQSDLIDAPIVRDVDAVVVTSTFLKEHYRIRYNVDCTVIDDAIEVPASTYKRHQRSRPVKVVWFGHADNWNSLHSIRQIIRTLGDDSFRLTTISNHPDADVRWSFDTFATDVLQHDVGVIPWDGSDWARAKSSNRLTTYMALGIPVIAAPIPAYLEILEHGNNGFVAHNESDWRYCLLTLADPHVRQELSDRARKRVLATHSLPTIGAQWLAFLCQLSTLRS